jgi:hypothetical protein
VETAVAILGSLESFPQASCCQTTCQRRLMFLVIIGFSGGKGQDDCEWTALRLVGEVGRGTRGGWGRGDLADIESSRVMGRSFRTEPALGAY